MIKCFFLKRDSVSLTLFLPLATPPGLWSLYLCGHMVTISELASYYQTDNGTGQVQILC